MEASKTGNAEDWEPVTDEPGMPLKLLTWRQKLSGKAKQEKKFRFYSLYSLVIRDRVVQMAVKLIIEPIFEADFNDCSYGYRPGRSAQDAIKAIQGHLKDGKNEVYDADLSGYFDSIPHDKLMECLRMRVVDGSVLRLIRQWLKAPVMERAENGKGNKVTRNDKGTPQGGVISPLLANLYSTS
jgi:RNA-directed DNA polymerase